MSANAFWFTSYQVQRQSMTEFNRTLLECVNYNYNFSITSRTTRGDRRWQGKFELLLLTFSESRWLLLPWKWEMPCERVVWVTYMFEPTRHAWTSFADCSNSAESKFCLHEIQAPGLLELQTNHGRSYFVLCLPKKAWLKHSLHLSQI